MKDYLGEVEVLIEETPYKGFTVKDWALEYAFRYGQIDGEHHKQWVIDQMTRVLMGTPVIIKLAKWGNGHKDYRFETDKPSEEYVRWVRKYEDNGQYFPESSYNKGIAP